MNLPRIIKGLFELQKAPELKQPAKLTSFIYVQIPEAIGPVDRGKKYEDPLELKLSNASLGHISGGGSMLGGKQPDGSRPIEFCGLDIDVTDLEKGLELLRAELPPLGIPDGTQLQYTIAEVRLQDVYAQAKWALRQPGA